MVEFGPAKLPSIVFKDFRIEYHGSVPHGFDQRCGLHVWKERNVPHDDIREGISRWNITQDSAPGNELQFVVHRRFGGYYVAGDYRLNSGDPKHFARRETMERVLELLLFMTDVRVHSERSGFWAPSSMELHAKKPFEKMRFTVRLKGEEVVNS